MYRQPSLFGVGANDPTPEDLAGLLAGPGVPGRMGGTGRVGVEVDAAWRVHALVAELVARDLSPGWEPAEATGRFVVRTSYSVRLAPLVAAWLPEGAGEGGKRPPSPLHLGGAALRLWTAAAGHGSPDGYLLRLGGPDDTGAVGAALRAAGVPAALVTAPEPAYRVTGRRRLARLAELVGEPPATAPPDAWP